MAKTIPITCPKCRKRFELFYCHEGEVICPYCGEYISSMINRQQTTIE